MQTVIRELSGVKDRVFSNIIIEGAVFAPPEKVKKYTDGKVIFEAFLQEADIRNQNKRLYPKNVLDASMKKIDDKIKNS